MLPLLLSLTAETACLPILLEGGLMLTDSFSLSRSTLTLSYRYFSKVLPILGFDRKNHSQMVQIEKGFVFNIKEGKSRLPKRKDGKAMDS